MMNCKDLEECFRGLIIYSRVKNYNDTRLEILKLMNMTTYGYRISCEEL